MTGPDTGERTIEHGLLHPEGVLTRNLLFGPDAFKPLGALLLAKLFDEMQPDGERRFWIRGDEPFDAEGQAEIRHRIVACFEGAKAW